MRALRVSLGALLAGMAIVLLWVTGLLPPPEGMRRSVIAFTALYPGPVSQAEVDRVECEPMARRHFYVVCTDHCEGEWRLIGIMGLRVEMLHNLNRVPPEDGEEVRHRINAFVARERLNLDERGARSMIGCHMRLAGLHPELILDASDLGAVARVRGDEGAMRRLAESREKPALDAMKIRETEDGYAAEFLYWDTAGIERPVLEVSYRITRDGQLRAVTAAGPVGHEGSGHAGWR